MLRMVTVSLVARRKVVSDDSVARLEEIREQFAQHVEQFPDKEERRRSIEPWQRVYKDLLARWGQAVADDSAMRERFLSVAGQHCSEEARQLFTTLRDALLKLCSILAKPARRQRKKLWPVPPGMDARKRRIIITGAEGHITTQELLDYREQEVHEQLDPLVSSASSDETLPPVDVPQQIRSRLRWVKDSALPRLHDIRETVGDFDSTAYDEAARRANGALRTLGPMFVQGEQADLWPAAYRLLLAYHAYSYDPDATFRPDTEGWASGVERVRAETCGPWFGRRGQQGPVGAAEDMRRMTEWLLQGEPSGGERRASRDEHDLLLTIDEFCRLHGKEDVGTYVLDSSKGKVTADTIRKHKKRYGLQGKHESGSGKKGDPYRWRESFLCEKLISDRQQ